MTRKQGFWIVAGTAVVVVTASLFGVFSSSWWSQRGWSDCMTAVVGPSQEEALRRCADVADLKEALADAKESGYATTTFRDLVQGGYADPEINWSERGGWNGQTGPPATWVLVSRACADSGITTGVCESLPEASACLRVVANLDGNGQGIDQAGYSCTTREEFEAARRIAIMARPCGAASLAEQRERCWTYGGIRSSEIALLRDSCEGRSTPLCREISGAPLSAAEREQKYAEDYAAAKRQERRLRDLICSNFPDDPAC